MTKIGTNMKREIINTSITVESNKAEYRQNIGGRKRYWDKRFCDDSKAIEARDCLIELRKNGDNFGRISEKIGVGIATISRVAGGNAGLIPREEYGGRSTTEYVLDCLKEMMIREV